jgi:arylsulfatase A-like enzyme
MESSDGSPFFAYLSFYSVHNPLHAKPEKREKYERKREQLGLDQIDPFVRHLPWMVRHDQRYPSQFKTRVIQSNPQYAAMVDSIDENVGRLMDFLEDRGMDENTLVIFTSDNGGLSTTAGSPTSIRPLRTGKGWLYEGGIRVPTIFRWKGAIPGQRVNDTVMTSADVFPTVMDAIGKLETLEIDLDGRSLLPVLTGQAGSIDRDAVFWHYPHHSNQGDKPASAIRKGRYKLIAFYESGRLELYDLVEDIGETRNLVDAMPEVAAELKQELDAWREASGAVPPGPGNPDYDPGL